MARQLRCVGITGVAWTADAEPASPDVVWRMTDASCRTAAPTMPPSIIPPPAEDSGARRAVAWTNSAALGRPGAALGFRRLSIIDLVTGLQPLANEDETVWISFNGEIYNHRELRRDLEARGHRFRTTATPRRSSISMRNMARSCVEQLRGMFALAIWDSRGDNGCFSPAIGSARSRSSIGTTAACSLAAS